MIHIGVNLLLCFVFSKMWRNHAHVHTPPSSPTYQIFKMSIKLRNHIQNMAKITGICEKIFLKIMKTTEQ